MKYREDEIPPELLAMNASNDMLVFSAFVGLAIGIAFLALGRKGHQVWMYTWGIAMIIGSLYLWLAMVFDFAPFGIV